MHTLITLILPLLKLEKSVENILRDKVYHSMQKLLIIDAFISLKDS